MWGTSAWCRRRQLRDSAREWVGRGQRGPTVETQTEACLLVLQARPPSPLRPAPSPLRPASGHSRAGAGCCWLLLTVRGAMLRSHGAASTETPLPSNEVSVWKAEKKKSV